MLQSSGQLKHFPLELKLPAGQTEAHEPPLRTEPLAQAVQEALSEALQKRQEVEQVILQVLLVEEARIVEPLHWGKQEPFTS
jgi:hypothetical protein